MENKTRGNGKTKKVVIGVATIVAVAAIAVPTALTLTGGNKDAGASTENNKYNVIVSSGIDGVPDYSLTIADGTKISELKSILKGVDGYRIEGIYKDDAMNHPYSDNETISSSTKIYIKFVAVTYTVNIYAEDGTTLVSTEEVNHKDGLTLTAPTKPEDNFATYEFKGWYNERNELVNLNEITSDLNIHPYYETHMKDYRIGFIYEAFKSSISVTIGGTPVTLDSTYHYGAKIVIRATQKVGRDITEFKVKVGTGETQDILTEAYRHEENGVVYYEYELDGNGDLSITYNEAASEYSIGQIPSQVTVTRNGHTLSSNEAIYYGDQLSISYRETEGYHKDTFSVDGAELVGNVYVVKGDLRITYTESKIAYTLGSIPSGVTVRRGEELLSSNSTIYYGDELTFTYTETSRRDTGNTKQESGYHYTEVETTIYSLVVNGVNIANERTYMANGDVSMVLNSNTSTAWERGEKVQYSLGTIPSGVTVTRDGETLTSDSVIYWGDVLSFTYTETSIRLTGNTKIENGFKWSEKATTSYTLIVNTTSLGSGRTFTVNGDVNINLSSTILNTNWEKGEQITFRNSSWTDINEVAQAGDAATVFSVGDEKDITLTDGEVLTVVILGFNHDNLTSGGKAKMSIGMKHLTKTTAEMNTNDTSVGGWEKSDMRKTLNDYYNKLPDDLKSVIKAVNKETSAGSTSTNIKTSSDKLWLFSMAEILSVNSITTINHSLIKMHAETYIKEGTQYEYYRNLVGDQDPSDACSLIVKKLSNGNEDDYWWWLRSPFLYNSMSYLHFHLGGVDGINPNSPGGICFGFCL